MTSSVDDVIALARHYVEVGRYDLAKSVVSDALSVHPQDPQLLAEYARAGVLLRDYGPAASAAYAALAVAPEYAFAMRMYATALDGLGRFGEAMWMSWRAVSAAPNDYLCHYEYASRLHKAVRYDDARVEVLNALRLAPDDADTHALYGQILQSMGLVGSSDDAYREALRLDPANAVAINNLAVNKLRRGRLTGAIAGFLGAASVDPGMGDLVRYNLGVVVTRALRRATWVATLAGLPVMLVGLDASEGHATAGLRVLAGVVTLVLGLLATLLLRSLPRTAWRSVVRARPWLAVRCGHVVLALGAGVLATVVGAPAAVLAAGGPIVIIVGVLTNFVGRLDDT